MKLFVFKNNMDWNYIAGFFDGEGNLHINALKKKGKIIAYQLRIRIYSSDEKVLLNIQKFLGSGKIYLKRISGVYELNLLKKKEVLGFLKNIQEKVILKKNQVDFVLKNYGFEKENNLSFDIDGFRGFITRKNVVRKHHTLKDPSTVK